MCIISDRKRAIFSEATVRSAASDVESSSYGRSDRASSRAALALSRASRSDAIVVRWNLRMRASSSPRSAQWLATCKMASQKVWSYAAAVCSHPPSRRARSESSSACKRIASDRLLGVSAATLPCSPDSPPPPLAAPPPALPSAPPAPPAPPPLLPTSNVAAPRWPCEMRSPDASLSANGTLREGAPYAFCIAIAYISSSSSRTPLGARPHPAAGDLLGGPLFLWSSIEDRAREGAASRVPSLLPTEAIARAVRLPSA